MTIEKYKHELSFQAHLAEYEAARNEILSLTTMQNQLVNYAVAIIAGAAIAVGQQDLFSSFTAILLIASLLTSAISWTLVRHQIEIIDISTYIRIVLSPKVEDIIGSKSISKFQVFKWEDNAKKRSSINNIKSILAMGQFAIAYIPSVIFVVAFYSVSPPQIANWNILETVLFWTALTAVVMFPIAVIFLIRIAIDDPNFNQDK